MTTLPEPEPEHERADDTVTMDPDEWTDPDHEMEPGDH